MTDSQPTVVEAWSAVMADVQGIGKHERNQQQGFSFRGIDSVMNAVGPALRTHNVVVVPEPVDIQTSTYQTSRGTAMFNAIVRMRYTITGPQGDCLVGGAFGEAADAGDKAVSKAQSVAYRVFLLQGLTIPTDEPDPDGDSHQRAAPPPAHPIHAVAETLDASQRTQVRAWRVQQRIPELSAMTVEQKDETLAWITEQGWA